MKDDYIKHYSTPSANKITTAAEFIRRKKVKFSSQSHKGAKTNCKEDFLPGARNFA